VSQFIRKAGVDCILLLVLACTLAAVVGTAFAMP